MPDETVYGTIDEDVRRRFEAACRDNARPRIEGFLASAQAPAYAATVEELIHIEMEWGWKRREKDANGPVLVEAYFARFPFLDREARRRLVKHEFTLRERYAGKMPRAEYAKRFPDLGLDQAATWAEEGSLAGQPAPAPEAIQFSCAACGMKFRVKAEFAGRSSKCPTCKTPLTVPPLDDNTIPFVAPERIDGAASSLAQAGLGGTMALAPEPPARAATGGQKGPQRSVEEILRDRPARGQRYVIDSEIARGGMGAVIRAVDSDIRREVAVKYLLDQRDARNKSRFVEEAQITGQLQHPNIPPIHELGVDAQKRLFFSMKLVHGRSLKEVLDQLREQPRQASKEWTLARLLTIFVNMCNGLAYAHARGVVHRDLKPANIMVGDFGEVYVMDWGLAKVLHQPVTPTNGEDAAGEAARFAAFMGQSGSASATGSGQRSNKVATSREADSDLTEEGSVVGTPLYMSPEQALGHIDQIDARSDIYSLGAILYEILTLQPPVARDGGHFAILMRVSQGEIIPPEQHAPGRPIPAELSAIALKALAKEKDHRYPTVEALRQDIERHLEGRSVSARHDTLREALWKLIKRNKTVSVAAAVILLVLVASMGFIIGAWRQTSQAYAAYQGEQDETQKRTRQAVPALVQSALLAAERRRFDDALEQASLALQYDATSRNARLVRGQLLLVKGKYEEARQELERCIQSGPPDRNLRRLLSACTKSYVDEKARALDLAVVLFDLRAYAMVEGVLSKYGKTSQDARDSLLDVYRTRLEQSWPKKGNLLTIDPHGLRIDRVEPAITDLSPLKGIPLTHLDLGQNTTLRDLTPLSGMPLRSLVLTQLYELTDLSPLHGMQLEFLDLTQCYKLTDIAVVKGMPLVKLYIGAAGVRDLSPVENAKLQELVVDESHPQIDTFRRMESLKTINNMPAAEFWKKLDRMKR